MTARRRRPGDPMLLVAAISLVLLPVALHLLGLTLSTAAMTVSLAIAAIGLNLLVGYTGLTSFGHSAWFGIGAFAAALAQRYLLPGRVLVRSCYRWASLPFCPSASAP